MEDVANYVKNKPDDADLDIHFFAVLDKSTVNGKVVICRQGGKYLRDMDDLDFLCVDAEEGAAELYAAQPVKWEHARASSKPEDLEIQS